jgi:hypothetical protein
LGFEGYAIGSVYDAAFDLRAPAGQAGAYPILEPSPGVGVYWSHESTLSYFPTLDATEPSLVATLPGAVSKRAHGVGFDDLRLILQGGDALLRNDGAWTPFATVPEVVGSGQVIRRPGGFYWRLRHTGTLHPYEGEAFLPPLTPLEGLDIFNGYQIDAASWRNGAVIAGIGTIESEPPGNTLRVAVTDEVLTTSIDLGNPEHAICQNGVSVVASPDGDSVYVGYLSCPPPPEDIAYVVRRFDCVSE